ncbi:MAG: hypothetical protein VBE63_18210 [Lamprobacter sp.]|uniref:hypothetical protein n=1 Tax=Lamprobacter sp. TaxID=3100796 RepID=UPI002B25F05F|nr:hypothetical protein [Lamprobacter sp.]MEA3641849.1 hypothetical protein [Lamprobacter sp.]
MTEDPANYRTPRLPADIARCPGVGAEDPELPGGIAWREGCERCLRRLASIDSEHTEIMTPPAILTFSCEWEIPSP